MVRYVLSFLVLLILGYGSPAMGASAENASPKEDYYELHKVLVDALDQVDRYYVKEVDRRELVEAAIEGILEKLDPYSAYIKPKDMPEFRTTVEAEFGGIGIQISVDDGKLKVISPLVGTPAYRAGVIAGDHIVEIDGKDTKGISLTEAVRRLKGKAGTKVSLTVVHPDSKKRVKLDIAREIIHVETVLGDLRKEDDSWNYFIKPEEHIGYIRITGFSRSTARELRKVLEDLKKDGIRALILDLRFNPGGLLNSAIEISDLFVSQGRIVSTKGRSSPERAWEAEKEGTFEGFPMAVLVNRYSASASEIVSACLQDHKRAVVIGERTWGKGSVQNVIDLEGGKSLLKLTTASYCRPNGKNIHRFQDAKDGEEWGVTPGEGFRIRLGDAEIVTLMRVRRERDIVKPHLSKEDESDPPDDKSTNGDATDGDATNGNAANDDLPGDDSAKPDRDATEGSGASEKPEKPEKLEKPEKPEEPEKSEDPPFIDRQLQKAIEYLSGELARRK